MGIFDKIFGNKEGMEYKVALAAVSNPLMDKINELPEREVREFFKTIVDAAERSLRGIVFMAPEEFNFKKQVSKEDIDFWLRKVSLAFMSYSYYFYGDAPGLEKNQALANLTNTSYKLYWQRMFNYYNQIFNEDFNQKEIDYYASGLKEDVEKGYAKSGNMEKVFELANRDYKTIASELLQKIWREDFSSNEKKGLFLGVRIWQAYQQIVQSFLVKLLNM